MEWERPRTTVAMIREEQEEEEEEGEEQENSVFCLLVLWVFGVSFQRNKTNIV
jgi:hypothetical protein